MQLSIIGLGLIGGSFGLALRSARPTITITGWDRDPAVVASAQDRGAIHHGAATIEEAAANADLVIIGTPVLAVRSVLETIAPHLRENTIVSDLASTKVRVLEWAGALLPPTVFFVGGHPMAGSEQHGIANARADLLRGAVYCLAPLPATPPDTLETIESLVTSIGARPLRIAAADHDAAVAAVSHLPFMLATALVQHTASDEHWPTTRRLAATGYRDMTRLASGDPAMHRDIVATNAAAIAEHLRGFARLLTDLADQLDDPDALLRFFEAAHREREAWLRERDGR
jgi:prephenate dehydrogenase